MTKPEFLVAFKPVLQAFGEDKFPAVVLDNAYKRSRGLDRKAVADVCEIIISNCDRPPTAAKIGEFMRIIRSRGSADFQPNEVAVQPLCAYCNDLRTIRVISKDEKFETLMLCACTRKSRDVRDDWMLPTWEPQWADVFWKEPCPVEWFKPRVECKNEDGSYSPMRTVDNARQYWEAKIRIASQYWRELAKKESPDGVRAL